MANYLVIYDRKPGLDYGPLHKHLEGYPTHWNFQKSAWIVGPAESAYIVANEARQHLDAKDLLFVQAVTPDSAWWGYDQQGSDWIASVVP
jgi:hypothetical protein